MEAFKPDNMAYTAPGRTELIRSTPSESANIPIAPGKLRTNQVSQFDDGVDEIVMTCLHNKNIKIAGRMPA